MRILPSATTLLLLASNSWLLLCHAQDISTLIPGDDPSAVRNLVQEDKGLTGSLPTQIGLMTNAEVLELSFNSLTGTIPSQIGLLTSLKILNWRHNQLKGPVPSQIGLLTQLRQVGLDENQLTGALPTEVANLLGLQTFNVGGTNAITEGTLPFAHLEETPFYENWIESFLEMTGSIPTEIGSCSKLTKLELHVQGIGGSIPSQTGRLALRSLQLEFNELEGPVPSQLGMMTVLTRLSLHDNQLTGSIPSTLGTAIALRYVQLDQNQLVGSLPSQLGSLTALQTLNLNENAGLSGSIDESYAELARLGKLREMNVTATGLGGSIPQDVCLITFECKEECYLDYDCAPDTGGLCGCSGCPCPISVLEPGSTYESGRFDGEGLAASGGARSRSASTLWVAVGAALVSSSLWKMMV